MYGKRTRYGGTLMTKVWKPIFVICVAVILAFGCKTAPETTEPEPVPVVPADIPQDLVDLKAAVEEARSIAIQYNINEFDPSGWSEAESLYSAGNDAYGRDNDAAKKAYSDALAAYESLFTAGLNEVNGQLVQQIYAAREKAVAAGASEIMPQELAATDIMGESYLSMMEDGEDPQVVYAGFAEVLQYYQALEQASLAVTDARRVDELGFASYDQQNYSAGAEALAAAQAAFGQEGSGASVLQDASAARGAFASVLSTGFGNLAANERAKADTAKKESDAIKASVTLKDRYDAAGALYAGGVQALGSGMNEDAYNAFSSAATAYAKVYEDALIKRNAALQAMENARKVADDTEALAAEADIIAPLPQETEENGGQE